MQSRLALGARAPPLLLLPGFDKSMVKTCSMHTINLGYGQQANGNVMASLLRRGTFGATALPLKSRLHTAYADFRAWLRERRITCSQPPFTMAMFNVRTDVSSPEMDSKAWNSMASAWLSEVTAASRLQDTSDEAVLCNAVAWGLSELYNCVERSPREMSEAQAAAAEEAGTLSLQAYNVLEGFEGNPDAQGQRNHLAGWRQRGLPWRQN